jgi:ubiquinone/menaquinone biosynthesis C-methylase UbiE/uncharacterized protein YbaR (Trm112 family)
MKTETVSQIRCPVCAANLAFAGKSKEGLLLQGYLICASGEHTFPVRDGIPQFVKVDNLQGLNRKYAHLYSWIAPFYDSSFFIASYVRKQFWPSGEEKARREIIDRLEIMDGDRVLETGIGTGANIPYLYQAADELALFGLDISPGMLKQCGRHLQRWGKTAELFLAMSEALPYHDGIFDVVFHVGGINTFTEKQMAINEMIRVAKPGTRIVIADEREELVTDSSLLSKLGLKIYFGRQLTTEIMEFDVEELLHLVPPTMAEVDMQTIWEGKGFLLSFRKPLAGSS